LFGRWFHDTCVEARSHSRRRKEQGGREESGGEQGEHGPGSQGTPPV
jgi:hypothetical protein